MLRSSNLLAHRCPPPVAALVLCPTPSLARSGTSDGCRQNRQACRNLAVLNLRLRCHSCPAPCAAFAAWFGSQRATTCRSRGACSSGWRASRCNRTGSALRPRGAGEGGNGCALASGPGDAFRDGPRHRLEQAAPRCPDRDRGGGVRFVPAQEHLPRATGRPQARPASNS